MIRNENTAKIYETWKNNSPPSIPRKMQMQPIRGEPEAQTKLREKQVLQNFQTEMELMKLRAESHEEKYQKIDSEMEEIISKKVNGQRKDHLKKLWKEECIREELRLRERWETSNIKWTDKYEAEFTKFYVEKNPFKWEEAFLPPKIRNSYRSKELETNSEQFPNTASENEADVIITGVSTYAQAAQKLPITGNYQSTTPGTTFIGKKVRFNNPDTNKPKPNIPKNPPTGQYNNNPRPPLINNPPFPKFTGVQNQNTQGQDYSKNPVDNRYPQYPPQRPQNVGTQNNGYNQTPKTQIFYTKVEPHTETNNKIID